MWITLENFKTFNAVWSISSAVYQCQCHYEKSTWTSKSWISLLKSALCKTMSMPNPTPLKSNIHILWKNLRPSSDLKLLLTEQKLKPLSKTNKKPKLNMTKPCVKAIPPFCLTKPHRTFSAWNLDNWNLVLELRSSWLTSWNCPSKTSTCGWPCRPPLRQGTFRPPTTVRPPKKLPNWLTILTKPKLHWSSTLTPIWRAKSRKSAVHLMIWKRKWRLKSMANSMPLPLWMVSLMWWIVIWLSWSMAKTKVHLLSWLKKWKIR